MDGIDAWYHFAGIVGISPVGHTLRRLWQMADAKIKQSRSESVQLAALVWGLGNLDVDAFIHYGEWSTFETGGTPKFSPEMEAKIQAEMERLKSEKANKS